MAFPSVGTLSRAVHSHGNLSHCLTSPFCLVGMARRQLARVRHGGRRWDILMSPAVLAAKRQNTSLALFSLGQVSFRSCLSVVASCEDRHQTQLLGNGTYSRLVPISPYWTEPSGRINLSRFGQGRMPVVHHWVSLWCTASDMCFMDEKRVSDSVYWRTVASPPGFVTSTLAHRPRVSNQEWGGPT